MVQIARAAAVAARRALRVHFLAHRVPPRVDDIPDTMTAEERIALLFEKPDSARVALPPLRGAPLAHLQWQQADEDCYTDLIEAVRRAARWYVNDMSVIGDTEEGRERAQRHAAEGRPFISLAVAGSLVNYLATGEEHSLSLSLLVWIPHRPLAAAVVTKNNILASDYTGAYWLAPTGEWHVRNKYTPAVQQLPHEVLLPESLREREARLAESFKKIHYVDVAGAGIADSVLLGGIPAGLHPSSTALSSAIALVAGGCGSTVRPVRDPSMCAWEAGDRIATALASDRMLPDLAIGPDATAVKRLVNGLVSDGHEHT